MRNDERRALGAVREEYAYLRDLLRNQENPNESATMNLEATYLIRLYATFEELLRRRLALVNDEVTLVNCIQQLSGEDVGYDPANDGVSLAWWRLFRRDRNLLAHGRGLIPALNLPTTLTLMETYLSTLKV